MNRLRRTNSEHGRFIADAMHQNRKKIIQLVLYDWFADILARTNNAGKTVCDLALEHQEPLADALFFLNPIYLKGTLRILFERIHQKDVWARIMRKSIYDQCFWRMGQH